jgi:Ras-related protein Rab-18
VVLLADVTKRTSFSALSDVWLKEVSMYCTRPAVAKMVVFNKIDLESEREVSREEGLAFARENSTLFVESSAKTALGVTACFEELVRKVLQTPELCSPAGSGSGAIQPGSGSDMSSYSDCAC